jgi:hypothetical protein
MVPVAVAMTPVARSGSHIGFDQHPDGFLPGRNFRVTVLVVMIFVMLVQVTDVLVIFLESLPGSGGNLVLFVLVDNRLCSPGAGRTFFTRGTFSPAPAPASATTTAAAGIPFLASRILHATGSRRALRYGPLGSFIHVVIVDPRQDVILLQIGIQVQIEIKFALARLFTANFLATRLLAARRSIVSARSWRAFIATASVFTPRLFPAGWRYVSASFLTAWRRRFAARLLSARGLVTTWFRPAALFATLRTLSSTLVARTAVSSAVPTTLFISLTRTFLPPRFITRLGYFFLFQVPFVVEIRLDHLGLLFKIVIQREARVVLEAPGSGPGRLGLQGHTGLKFIQRIRNAGRLLRDRPFGDRFFRNWFGRNRFGGKSLRGGSRRGRSSPRG